MYQKFIQENKKIDKELRFNINHVFTILQLTDLHYSENYDNNIKTLKLQYDLIKQVNPDLVVVTGDIVVSEDPKSIYPGFVETRWSLFSLPFLDLQKKYAIILGNHDTEQDATPFEIMKIDQQHPFSLYDPLNIEEQARSNYYLQIKSSFSNSEDKSSALLWMFDTHENINREPNTSGCIYPCQVKWYEQQSQIIQTKQNQKVNGLAFIHVPIRQFLDLWNEGKTRGIKNQSIDTPEVNTYVFESFIQQKNIKGIFAGHCHDNDFSGNYEGIELICGRKSGYSSTGSLNKGGTVIKLKEFVNQDNELDFQFDYFTMDEFGKKVEYQETQYQGKNKEQQRIERPDIKLTQKQMGLF